MRISVRKSSGQRVVCLPLVGEEPTACDPVCLHYPGKLSTHRLFESVPEIRLVKVREFGMSGNGTGWKNMVIKGDNLSVLQYLISNSQVRNQVDLVYIDPPFSTRQEYRKGTGRTATVSSSASDQLAYSDHLEGAEYIEFVRRRLMSLHAILSQQGSLYVHIDCKVGHYLKIVLDEIFGQKCFVNDITRIKCNPKNFSRKGFGNLKDMVLFYSKSDKPYWKGSRETMSDCDIERLFPKMDKQGRRYTTTPLHAPGETAQGPTGKPWKGMRPPRGRHWRYPPVELDRLDKMGLIEWSSTGNPRKIIYAETAIQNGKKRQDIWEFKDPPNPSYPTEKNLAMIQMIVEASSEPGGLVLDCFAGSGTTAVAAESCGRRWIMIDNSEAAIDTMIERIHRLPSPKPFILFETIVP